MMLGANELTSSADSTVVRHLQSAGKTTAIVHDCSVLILTKLGNTDGQLDAAYANDMLNFHFTPAKRSEHDEFCEERGLSSQL